LQLLQQKEGETLRKYLQRFSQVHRNIPEIHPTAVIVAFQSNLRNCRIRSKMNIRLTKTVNELYTLVDKCARVEEGRKLPGEEDCVDIDSEDDDETISKKKKNKKHNKKCKDKTVMTVEGSGMPSTGKKAKAEPPARRLPHALTFGRQRLPRKLGTVMDHTARFIGPRAMISRSVIRLSSSSRGKRLSMRSTIMKKVRMALAGRAGVVKQIEPARLLRTKGNPPKAERRRIAVTRVMEGMKRKPASRNSRRPLTPCALTGCIFALLSPPT
jgi:hypothetical protein